jgi:hypothetical protein
MDLSGLVAHSHAPAAAHNVIDFFDAGMPVLSVRAADRYHQVSVSSSLCRAV